MYPTFLRHNQYYAQKSVLGKLVKKLVSDFPGGVCPRTPLVHVVRGFAINIRPPPPIRP